MAWAVLGAGEGQPATGYSATTDSISGLAQTGASTRLPMTAGIVAFGIGVPLFALALRSVLPGPAWMLVGTGGLATLGVALFPLGTPANDAAHVACVAVAYVSLVAAALLAARPLRDLGRPRAAHLSTVAGVVAGGLLLVSVLGPLSGLFQRAGLGVLDLWLMAGAGDLLLRRQRA